MKEYLVTKTIMVKEFIKLNISKKFYRYIKKNSVIYYINNIESQNYSELKPNDLLRIEYIQEKNSYDNILELDLKIIYEDEYLLVIDKPHGLQTIPSRRDNSNSLYNAILNYYKSKDYINSIHFINRLDKDTGGLVLVAKDKYTALLLNKSKDNINREYYAKCDGIFSKKEDRIINNIIKDEITGKRVVSNNGKVSITNYKVLFERDGYSYLQLSLETGRTHQIRVHLSNINHPIIGDKIYGEITDDILFLYSYKIEFDHPILKKRMEFEIKPLWMEDNTWIK